jgi:seryl-tRNA synthetase
MKMILNHKVAQESVQHTIRTQLRFYYPEITDVFFTESGIEVHADADLPEEKVEANVAKLIAKFARLKMKIPQKVLFDSQSEAADSWQDRLTAWDKRPFMLAAERVVKELREAHVDATKFVAAKVVPVRKGLNVYTSEMATLYDMVDLLFKAYFQAAFGAQNLKVPSMISTAVVERAGYFDTGCQHISFVAPISNDPDLFEQFQPFWNEHAEDGYCRHGELKNYLKTPKDVLTPAVCLHTYPLFENIKLPSDQVIALTCVGSVFRDESGNLNNDERLNEFTMREGVFYGHPDRLKDIHADLVNFIVFVGLVFGLQFRLETATDMFFNENAEQQLFSQLLSDNKIEFAVYSEKISKYMATTSINKHHNHFSKNFGMTDESDNFISTMCMGVGVSRIVFALQDRVQNGLGVFADEMEARLAQIRQQYA